MFEDSLFASTARPNPRRGWTAAISFGFQAVILGILVLVPMVFTNALPVNSLKGLVFLPPVPTRPAGTPRPPEVRHARQNTSNFVNNELQAPREVPHFTHRVVDTQAPESSGDYTGPGIDGAIPVIGNQRGNAISALLNGIPQPVQPLNIAPRSVRLSMGVTEGLLIHRVVPVYPSLARQAGIQGQVLLQATIGRDGTIQNLLAVNGHPMLVPAAIDAVRQWRYRPYLLNDQPVEVETQITVNFTLGR